MIKIPFLGINTQVDDISNNNFHILYENLKKCFEYGIKHIYINQHFHGIYTNIINSIEFTSIDRNYLFISIEVNTLKDIEFIEQYIDKLKYIDFLLYSGSNIKIKNKLKKILNIRFLSFENTDYKIKNINDSGYSQYTCIKLEDSDFKSSNEILNKSIELNTSPKNILICELLRKNLCVIVNLNNFEEIIDYSKSLNLQKFI
jgi:hypothetical protein